MLMYARYLWGLLCTVLIPIFLVVSVLVYLEIGKSSTSYHKCHAQNADYQKDPSYDRSPRVAPVDRALLFFECEAYFSSQNEGIITAFATVIIGVFTVTLWLSHRDHVKLTREIERAYFAGGGPVDRRRTPRHFVLTVQNYGKTPGYLTDFAVEIDTLAHVQANRPAYLAVGYQKHHFADTISPIDQMKAIWTVPITIHNAVAYGRFWYKDIWHVEHCFSFILPLERGNDHSVVRDVDDEYRKWT